MLFLVGRVQFHTKLAQSLFERYTSIFEALCKPLSNAMDIHSRFAQGLAAHLISVCWK